MATSAQYASTPVFGSANLTTADTSLTAPTTFGTILTAGASGTRIDYIDIQGVATTVAGLINLFVFDGTNYILWQGSCAGRDKQHDCSGICSCAVKQRQCEYHAAEFADWLFTTRNHKRCTDRPSGHCIRREFLNEPGNLRLSASA